MAFNLSSLFSKGAGSGTPSTLIPGLKSGKTRQYMVVGALLVALYLGLYLIFATSTEKPKQQVVDQQKVLTTHIAAAGESVDLRERWIGTAGTKVADHDARLAHEEQTTKDLLTRFNAIEQEVRAKAGNASAQAVPPLTQSQPAPATTPVAKALTPLITPPAKFPPGSPSSVAQGQGGSVTLPPAPNASNRNPEAYGGSSYIEPSVEIGHVRLGAKPDSLTPAPGKSPASSTSSPVGGKAETQRMTSKTYLPVGFVKASLLGGIDAPTGGQAQSNPLPVMLRIKDLAILPNHFRANVRDCMVVGAGYGDISSERAYVRIESLSCIRNDGQVLEVKAQGSVYGEDGKLGIRGRLISKQGQILATGLLAGVVSGIGKGIENQSSTTTVSTFGTSVTQPHAGEEMRAGIASGMGKALDRLANYYISLAEKVFPVIEVDSNRDVEIAFTKGIELSIPLPEMKYGGGPDDE